MMANAPVAQKGGFASAIGTGKPAATMEGMGMDFLALLESMDALPAEGETALAPATVSGSPVAALPALQCGELTVPAVPTVGVAPLLADAIPSAIASADTASVDAAPESSAILPEAAVPARRPAEKALAQPVAAKLTGTASALPHLAQAMSHKEEAAPAGDGQGAEAPDGEEKAEKPRSAMDAPVAGSGLALSLLQNVEQLAHAVSGGAVRKEGAVGASASDPQVAALNAFALPPAALRQAAALPGQADEPARQQAFERLQSPPEDVILPNAATLPETAPVPEEAPAAPAVHHKTENPAGAAQIPATAIPAETNSRTAAPAVRRADAAQPVETAAASIAPVNPAPAPVAPVMPPPFIDAAAPLMNAPAMDTAAVLGKQVIDMGVDGQWIDRMAREIADISAGTGRASFTLNPDNLGRLQVEILQRDEGADVRLIAETDDAVNALNQGRHQLQQDSRLQAARINDVQIERGSGNSDNAPVTRSPSAQDLAQQQGQSQSQAFHKKPLIESVSSMARGEEPGEEADRALSSRNARYA